MKKGFEKENQRDLDEIQLPGDVASIHPPTIESLAKRARQVMSPVHFLVFKCLQESAGVCASHTNGIDQAVQIHLLNARSRRSYATLVSLRLDEVTSGLQYMISCECVAHYCL